MATIFTYADDGPDLEYTTELDVNLTNLNSDKVEAVPASTAGTNTITVNDSPTRTAYTTNEIYTYKITNTNTGGATLNINTLGAKTIKTLAGLALIGGELRAGNIHMFKYDGTDMILVNPWSYPPEAIDNHTNPVSCRYWYNGSSAPSTFNMATSAQQTWISVGATGTVGVDREWDMMDELPSDAKVIYATCYLVVNTDDTDDDVSYFISARPEGNSVWGSGLQYRLNSVDLEDFCIGNAFNYATPCTIVLNETNGQFEFYWDEVVGADSESLWLVYRGFGS